MKLILRLITFTVVLTLFVFAFVSLKFWRMDRELITRMEKDLQLQVLTEEIIHLGEVLTMSGKMAAQTNDLSWETQYEEFIPQLSTSIRGLLELASQEDQDGGVLRTYQANQKKVGYERQAFEFVRQGQREEAVRLLTGNDYESIKSDYKRGIEAYEVDLAEQIKSRLNSFEKRSSVLAILVTVGVIMLAVFWIIVLILMKREFERRKDSEKALRGSEKKLRKIIDLVPHMIFAKDKEGRFILVNQALADAYDTTIEKLIGVKQTDIHPSQEEFNSFMRDDLEVIREGKPKFIPAQSFLDIHGKTRILQTIKIPFLVPGQSQFAVLGVAVDITDQKKAEEKLLHNAFYDSLTDLPTRTLFLDRLSESANKMKRDESYKFAVFYIDLDRFKVVNDSLGHLRGDQLLIGVAYRLRNQMKKMSAISRVGGDEFAILVEGIYSQKEAQEIAEGIKALFITPFHLEGHEVYTSVSIGIVISSRVLKNASDILRGADTAMYVAKTNGRSRYEFFDKEMHTHAVTMLGIESDLRRAIENQQFSLVYQPIVSVKTEKMVGFEALVRWDHPEQGQIMPGRFIEIAEESGMIVPLGWWVFERTCQQIATWKKKFDYKGSFYVSVNFSGKQLHHEGFAEKFKNILDRYGIATEMIRIEITEYVLLDESEVVAANIEKLKQMNAELYMDDFGTGYSSLSLLRRLDVQKIKIDRSFTQNLEKGGENLEIVQGVTALAHNLGIEVIAEGVETKESFKKIKQIKCDYVQGYYFSVPLDEAQATDYMRQELLSD